jgi:hypothetical protein
MSKSKCKINIKFLKYRIHNIGYRDSYALRYPYLDFAHPILTEDLVYICENDSYSKDDSNLSNPRVCPLLHFYVCIDQYQRVLVQNESPLEFTKGSIK